MPSERRLAAIMFTDIVGYTALMGSDERAAFEILASNRSIQKPLIENFNGKWVKELGDGVMATFNTATDAVQCAANILQKTSEVDGLQLRIGIHLGEIVEEDNDVFGDGVNIAARLQSAAPVGGIYISDSVQKNISNKRGIDTRFISEINLKNVKDPVRVFEVTVGLLGPVLPALTAHAKAQPASEKSIAILSFANMSGDPEQEYFSDGMAEEILNSLGNIRDLNVVSRTSSFQYKGKNTDLRQIGEELAVANVLEGSIRKQGNRIRVTVQLVEVKTGYNLWAERYDRNLDDIFAVQDEIALAVTEKLKITLLQKEREYIQKAPTLNTEAYEYYLKGRFYWGKRGKWLGLALENFNKAVTLDPDFAAAYAGIADAYSSLGMYGIIPPYDAMPKAKAAAAKALALDPNLLEAFVSIAFINGFYENDRVSAHENFNKALDTNRKYAPSHNWYSFYLSTVEQDLPKAQKEGLAGIAAEPHNAIAYYVTGLAYLADKNFPTALYYAHKAIEIDPSLFLPYFLVGWCSLLQNNLDEAEKYLQSSLELSGRHSWPMGFMILTKSHQGKTAEAKALMNEIIERNKKEYFSVFGAAIGATAVGDNQLALSFLEKGYRDKDTLLHIFKHLDTIPESLTKDPEFLKFMERTGLLMPQLTT
jgi:adenylate cyclase